MGTIYKRGAVYWIQYYKNGKPFRESTRSHKETEAKRLLKRREGEVAEGKLPGVYFDRVRFDELAEELLRDYRINKKKSFKRVNRSVEHLKEYFEGFKVSQITTPHIQRYIEMRQDEGAANGTINRELSALKRMLNLGAKQTPPKVDRVPYIPLLKESHPRQGFFEHAEFIALRDALPDYLKGFVTFAYKTGWRVSEISNLKWGQVNLDQGIVRLDPGETKNDEGRTLYLDEELKEVFVKQWETRRKGGKLIPYVFTNHDGSDKIKRFDKAWIRAFQDAGIQKRLFHDLRRTAIRNMVRAGIPERVAMMVSGHKTRSVFDRYNIVSTNDLKEAAIRQEAYLQSQNDHRTTTIVNFGKKRRG